LKMKHHIKAILFTFLLLFVTGSSISFAQDPQIEEGNIIISEQLPLDPQVLLNNALQFRKANALDITIENLKTLISQKTGYTASEQMTGPITESELSVVIGNSKFRDELPDLEKEIKANYQEYYGGLYVKPGKAVILLTDISNEITSSIARKTPESNGLEFQKVDYTLQQLQQIRDKIASLTDKNILTSFGIDILKNRVYVSVVNDNKENQDIILNLIDPKYVIFVKTEPIVLNAEDNITNRYSGSIGKSKSIQRVDCTGRILICNQ